MRALVELLTPSWVPLRPIAVQQAAYHTSAKYVALPCGRRSGKTELARRRIVKFLAARKPWPDPVYAYCLPVRDQAKRVAWSQIINLIPPSWFARAPSISDMVIETVFGSKLLVVGMDKPHRLEGIDLDGVVMDESCDQRPGAYDLTISPMLGLRDAWAWRIGVPKRQGTGATEYRKWCEAIQAGIMGPKYALYWWPSSAVVPEDFLRERRENMDARDYEEQFEARWQTVGGGIFHAFDRERNVRPCTYRRDMPLIVSQDFNVDPMCWVIGHCYMDERGEPDRVEWIDEIFKRNTNTQACCDVLFDRYQGHAGGVEFYGDANWAQSRKTSASLTDIAIIMQHEGFKQLGRTQHYRKANPVISDRFAACNAMFLNAAGRRRMHIDPKCVWLIKDLEMRHYQPGTSVPADKGDDGHMTDAMGYFVHARFPMRLRLSRGDD